MNNVSKDDGYPVNLDLATDLRLRIAIGSASVLILVFNGISLVALNRTSHTPKTARFLSSALLAFDFVSLFMFTVRKLVQDGRYNLLIQLLAMGWSFIAYVNIAIMSLERLIVIQWPHFYLRCFSFSKIRAFSLSIWTICTTFYSAYVTMCLFLHYSEVDANACFGSMMEIYIQVTVSTSALISCLCLGRIGFLIRRHSNKKTMLPTCKSTIVLFLCVLNYLITALFYAIILLLTVTNNKMRRVYMDVIMCFNVLADSCVYVWWYKEGRLEVLKMFATIFPTLDVRVEKMRIEIFDIMTYSSRSQFQQSKKTTEETETPKTA